VKLIDESLEERTFNNGSMKYVPLSTDVHLFLVSHNLNGFDPAVFTLPGCGERIARQKPQAYLTGATDWAFCRGCLHSGCVDFCWHYFIADRF